MTLTITITLSYIISTAFVVCPSSQCALQSICALEAQHSMRRTGCDWMRRCLQVFRSVCKCLSLSFSFTRTRAHHTCTNTFTHIYILMKCNAGFTGPSDTYHNSQSLLTSDGSNNSVSFQVEQVEVLHLT